VAVPLYPKKPAVTVETPVPAHMEAALEPLSGKGVPRAPDDEPG
jgi:hypothetical protein